MTEFTKTKMNFALAMLGTLFALHKILETAENASFNYLGVDLKVQYLYSLVAGLLGLTVYCYALSLLSHRPSPRSEKVGNYVYALALMVVPLYGLLYGSSLVAEHVGNEHLKVTAPMVALSLGFFWLLVSQLLAFRLRGRLGAHDRQAKLEQIVNQEITSLNRTPELFEAHHYDLAVIESWKAIEARLRRVLLSRGYTDQVSNAQALIDQANRAGMLTEPVRKLLDEVRNAWNVAVSNEPLTREAAEHALQSSRVALASIAVGQPS